MPHKPEKGYKHPQYTKHWVLLGLYCPASDRKYSVTLSFSGNARTSSSGTVQSVQAYIFRQQYFHNRQQAILTTQWLRHPVQSQLDSLKVRQGNGTNSVMQWCFVQPIATVICNFVNKLFSTLHRGNTVPVQLSTSAFSTIEYISFQYN